MEPNQQPSPTPNEQPMMQPQPVVAVPAEGVQPQVMQPITEQPAPAQPVMQPQQPVMTQPQEAMPVQPVQMSSQQTPTMPVQPAAPSSGPISFSSMSSKMGGKKKLITLAAGVAGVALILVVGLVAYKSLFSVSKEDYRKASTTVSTAETKLSDVNIALIGLNYSSSLTETKINNNTDTVKKSLAEYEDAVKKLSDEKALKNSEINKQYKAFKELSDKYVPLVKAYAVDSQKLMIPVSKCDDAIEAAASTTAAGISSISSCLTQLSAVKDLTDSDLKSLLDIMISSYKSIKSILEQLDSTPTSDYATRSQLRSQYYDADETLRKRISDIDSNITKKFNDGDPRDELRTLSDGIFNAMLKK